MSRPICFLAVSAALLLGFSSGAALADPAENLSAAQAREAAAAGQLESAERELVQAEALSEPVAAKADQARDELSDAEAELASAEEELVDRREAAAADVEAAEGAYESERSDHQATTATGTAIAALALLVGAGALVYPRFGRWPLSRPLSQLLAGVIGVLVLGGLALAVIPSAPAEPTLDPKTLALAEAAEEDPTDSPSPAMEAVEARLPALEEAAEPLEAALKGRQADVEAAQESLTRAENSLTQAKRQVAVAQRVVNRAESEAREEASFREEASTIDYDQLIKNPEAHRGEKVVYTGQVFQIIEEGGIGFMLLSVTDEGYGFWDDNIWVNFFEPVDAAEEDIITVYGKLTGSEEYETQIGGSTFVPRMNARYIDE